MAVEVDRCQAAFFSDFHDLLQLRLAAMLALKARKIQTQGQEHREAALKAVDVVSWANKGHH